MEHLPHRSLQVLPSSLVCNHCPGIDSYLLIHWRFRIRFQPLHRQNIQTRSHSCRIVTCYNRSSRPVHRNNISKNSFFKSLQKIQFFRYYLATWDRLLGSASSWLDGSSLITSLSSSSSVLAASSFSIWGCSKGSSATASSLTFCFSPSSSKGKPYLIQTSYSKTRYRI